jgi:putative ABC transport system permease protein
VPIAAGAVVVLAIVLATGVVPLTGIVVVPIGGIVLGGAMTATSLAGRRALDELDARRGEFEAAAQVLVLIGLLAAEGVAVVVTVELVARGLIRRGDPTDTRSLRRQRWSARKRGLR